MNDRRLQACVEQWPEAETGMYDPHCCRWPKSCSATIYDPERVTDEDLEPRPARLAVVNLPDQPDGIDEDSRDLPAVGAARERVEEFLSEWGDGRITRAGAAPLYARDLQALVNVIRRIDGADR